MFHEVRILDRKGNTKKVLSSKFLSKRYWNSFFESTSKTEASKKSRRKEENKSDKKSKFSYENLYFAEDWRNWKTFAKHVLIQEWVYDFSNYLILHQGCELENKNITPASGEQIQKELLPAPLFSPF